MDKLRLQINQIDYQLLILLKKRIDIVTQIGKYKKENKMNIYHANREKEVIEKLINYDLIDDKLVFNLWQIIMDYSKKIQSYS